MKTLKVFSDLSELSKIKSFLEDIFDGLDLPENDSFGIELSLQEICVNITRYAYPESKGEIHLKSWMENKRIYFEIADAGIPFNPLEVEKPDLQEMIRKEQKGGLGIFLTIKLMDGVSYTRDGDRNILTMHKEINKPPESEMPDSV